MINTLQAVQSGVSRATAHNDPLVRIDAVGRRHNNVNVDAVARRCVDFGRVTTALYKRNCDRTRVTRTADRAHTHHARTVSRRARQRGQQRSV
jgi:hypothetical protein